ncbi:General stress protein 69 [Botrimarina colliarenosi]|uniref:General stress protein 69 n=1 Tax=Botrimarina colliarenosi TaxID=2528001 RepID=A0A5C6AJ44_9BACT|nr:aldo/keto reductase [Botrimarina colliarenosi]TWU00045.1 General stress protein 69 [Botrimarina colliarenosi]
MHYRRLGKTGFDVSEIALGTWQVGGKWGAPFDDALAESILDAAIDRGVNFIDTADVYGDQMSEAAVGRVVRRRSEKVYVATKCGRRIRPHVDEGYTVAALRGFVEASLANSGLETLDLIQLHCPPPATYYRPEIFGLFDDLKAEGKVQNLGVSVEKVEEALKAIEYPNVTTIQIIFNLFRQRPAGLFFREAQARDIGVIVRVPLASGLLTGKFGKETTFAEGDHRHFNRDGAGFDKGETFAGIPYDVGLQAVNELQDVFPGETNLAQAALRWILDHPAVSTVIPGASRVEQIDSNLSASERAPLSEEQRAKIDAIYAARVKPLVHQLW